MHFLFNATGGEEMLIAPIMSIYRLPQGQYGYGGHIINLSQDVASFTHRLPRLSSELDILIVRKQGANHSHQDFICHIFLYVLQLVCEVVLKVLVEL